MARTLKEQYVAKKLQNLQSRLHDVDKRVISELKADPRDRLIMEAFDKQQMAAAVDIIKKLKALKFGNLDVLASARDAAVSDVTKVLSGDKSQGMVRKIVNLFKGDKENPLVDTIAFANAMKNFFDQFTPYIDALAAGKEDQTLGTLVTGKSPDEVGDIEQATKNVGTETKKKLGELQKIILNGFKPEGALANLGKNWIDKYLGGRKGLQNLTQKMMTMTVKDLKTVAQGVSGQLQNTDAVGEAMAGAAEQGAVRSTGTDGGEQTAATKQTGGPEQTKKGGVAPGPQVAAKAGSRLDDPGEMKDFVASYQKKIKDVPGEHVAKVISALKSGGQLK
jgi:hypothetical protein